MLVGIGKVLNASVLTHFKAVWTGENSKTSLAGTHPMNAMIISRAKMFQ